MRNEEAKIYAFPEKSASAKKEIKGEGEILEFPDRGKKERNKKRKLIEKLNKKLEDFGEAIYLIVQSIERNEDMVKKLKNDFQGKIVDFKEAKEIRGYIDTIEEIIKDEKNKLEDFKIKYEKIKEDIAAVEEAIIDH